MPCKCHATPHTCSIHSFVFPFHATTIYRIYRKPPILPAHNIHRLSLPFLPAPCPARHIFSVFGSPLSQSVEFAGKNTTLLLTCLPNEMITISLFAFISRLNSAVSAALALLSCHLHRLWCHVWTTIPSFIIASVQTAAHHHLTLPLPPSPFLTPLTLRPSRNQAPLPPALHARPCPPGRVKTTLRKGTSQTHKPRPPPCAFSSRDGNRTHAPAIDFFFYFLPTTRSTLTMADPLTLSLVQRVLQ
ncbi:hypothetical protein BDZ85DRAFT_58003 [Elsinoe ampelina]|uniref:Uncharacterized protein n=1 Tax=Elsinoe ampelina TaxID=302913 RepID=A0A6A6GMV0_9PEZI|nr:hypothetical protein BDZ85DRAFT_58003 [Elsinoe ampelina]